MSGAASKIRRFSVVHVCTHCFGFHFQTSCPSRPRDNVLEYGRQTCFFRSRKCTLLSSFTTTWSAAVSNNARIFTILDANTCKLRLDTGTMHVIAYGDMISPSSYATYLLSCCPLCLAIQAQSFVSCRLVATLTHLERQQLCRNVSGRAW
ncbi:hypothetical protein BDW22DRAFT_604487 [Trametopsis cervina]|nr:hypothetical protein BDW22DRAFT_604487 [Trametopsis cervina]